MTHSRGVSVVICSYNGEQRLPNTMAALANQRFTHDLSWEVIVVDNASDDNTSSVARQCWQERGLAPLRVLDEMIKGKVNAISRGFTEAKYEYVSFIDDDNWVASNWVELAFEVMENHPDVGACGGFNDARFETSPPSWFEHYKDNYAVGAQNQTAGEILQKRGFLWGAGLTVRKTAWRNLVDQGYHPILVGRRGNSLMAGSDQELCLALLLGGWRLWYEPRLRLRHFIPGYRLNWGYLQRLYTGFGIASIGHDPYRFRLERTLDGLKGKSGKIWLWKARDLLANLARDYRMVAQSLYGSVEGDPMVPLIRYRLGRLSALLRMRNEYDLHVERIWNAPWVVGGANGG